MCYFRTYVKGVVLFGFCFCWSRGREFVWVIVMRVIFVYSVLVEVVFVVMVWNWSSGGLVRMF